MSLIVSTMSPLKVGSATVLPVTDLQFSPEINVGNYRHSGNEFPSVGVVPGAAPRIRFKTPFQGAFNAFGLKLTYSTVCSIFFATFASGIKQSGANHDVLALNTNATAVYYIVGASVGRNGLFMADVEVILLSPDYQTHPFAAIAGGATLPTLAAEPQLHTLGPFTFGGTSPGTPIEGVSNWGFQQNIQVMAETNDGDRFPRTCIFAGADPQIMVEHEDPISVLSSLGLLGSNIATVAGAFARGIDPTTQLTQSTGVQILVSSGRALPGPVSFSFGRPAKSGIIVRSLAATAAGPQSHPFAVSLGATLPTLA